LVGNHLSLLDPVLVGLSNRFRVTFFTKVEVFERVGAIFFRWTGQIPIRRGDEASTKWALEIAADAVARGSKLSIYPEGTRSADGVTLHRLHRRVLIPVLQSNATVPIHAMTIAYTDKSLWRRNVEIRFSECLTINREDSADTITQMVTDALIELGGMPYVHTFSRIHSTHRESPYWSLELPPLRAAFCMRVIATTLRSLRVSRKNTKSPSPFESTMSMLRGTNLSTLTTSSASCVIYRSSGR
jgi:hypothetical protein